MDSINKPHDKFFKALVQDFIHHYLPEEVLGIIDMDSISPEKDSFIILSEKTPSSKSGRFRWVMNRRF